MDVTRNDFKPCQPLSDFDLGVFFNFLLHFSRTGRIDLPIGQAVSERRNNMALDAKTKELVALGAAVAGNCLPCLQWHYKKCRELGITVEDIRESIQMAQTVKQVPIDKISSLADTLTGDQVQNNELKIGRMET